MDDSLALDIEKIFTIGVYGSTEDAFFGTLKEKGIDLFIDVRARRGMRGAKYKFVNSKYLQARLRELGIAYAHLAELAPTKEIRAAQYLADKQAETTKRERRELSTAFTKAYRRDVLKVFKRKPEHRFFADEMLKSARELAGLTSQRPLRRVVLFCVEQEQAACHRSLVADELQKQLHVHVEHMDVSRQMI